MSADKPKIDPKLHKQLEKSIDNVNKDDKEAIKATGFGDRVRTLRLARDLSQIAVAKQVGCSRSTIAQWENGSAIPRLRKMGVLANVLDTTSHYLTHGIEDGPTMVQPDMSDIGCYLVSEVVFGESPTDTTTTMQWGLPTQWLRHDLNVMDVTKVILYRIEAAYAASRYEHGDTLVIDTGYHRLSPGGTFLYWDGVGPAIADISVIPVPVKNKVLAKIRNMDGTEFEADVDALVIIGRVRGLWRKS